MTRILIPILIILALGTSGRAEETFPKAGWEEQPNPLAGPLAEVGGKMSVFVSQFPKSFNYYLDNNTFCAQLFDLMFDTLLSSHPITLELEPALARGWSISDDKLTFTFKLDPDAKWSDGKPITARDVAWTCQAIMKPENLTGAHKVALENLEPPEVIDDHTVRFRAKEVHWRNLLAIGTLHILPRHAFEHVDFNKANFEFPVVSGRYRLGEIKEGIYARVERRDDWWRDGRPSVHGVGNFETLEFRFYAERENAYEAFKQDEFDLFAVYTSHRWVQQTTGDRFDKNWIVKQEVHNYNPVGFQGFAMNMRRPPFDDLKVRRAMCHLLNRRKLNETLMHNQYFLHRSYFEDLYDAEHPCRNEAMEFDEEKARRLLAEAGYVTNPDTGFLEKDGRPLRFTFLTRDASSDKFLVIFQEDLKNAGVEMKIETKDWAAWARDMDEFNYDMTWAAWGASVWKDPEGMWHSKEADRISGNNITGFKHPRVDELIDQQKSLFDIDARNDIVREIDRIVYAEFPYVLLWNIDYTRLLYWNRFGTPDTVLSRYGDESSAYLYWWADPNASAELEQAMKDSLSLPPKPYKIDFDASFSPPIAEH